MKKLLLSLGLVLVLTGCGGKKLTCTAEEEEMGMKMVGKATITFKGDKVAKVKETADVTVTDEMKSLIDTLKSSLEESYNKYNDYGVKAKVTVKDATISTSIEYNVNKISDENLEKLKDSDIYYSGTYDEVKKALEDEGFTCK